MSSFPILNSLLYNQDSLKNFILYRHDDIYFILELNFRMFPDIPRSQLKVAPGYISNLLTLYNPG